MLRSNTKLFLLIVVGFISIGLISLYLFIFADFSSNKKATIPRQQIPKIETEQIFTENSEFEQKVKTKFVKIHSFLKDTLTDSEEGEVLKIVEESKGDSSLNLLLIKLGETNLLKNLVIRWEEEAFCFNSPGMISSLAAKLSGKKFAERPQNINYENAFFDNIFLYKELDKKAGIEVLSAFNGRFFGNDYIGPESTTQGLQGSFINILLDNNLNEFSPATIELAKEVFSKKLGTASAIQSTNLGRRKLGIIEL